VGRRCDFFHYNLPLHLTTCGLEVWIGGVTVVTTTFHYNLPQRLRGPDRRRDFIHYSLLQPLQEKEWNTIKRPGCHGKKCPSSRNPISRKPNATGNANSSLQLELMLLCARSTKATVEQRWQQLHDTNCEWREERGEEREERGEKTEERRRDMREDRGERGEEGGERREERGDRKEERGEEARDRGSAGV
jgi:hypothetical protein